ncbi:646_t:CDS:1, partial [Gigaspora rosea]
MVKKLERDIRFQKIKLDDLDECFDRETVVDLIHEIVLSLINEK